MPCAECPRRVESRRHKWPHRAPPLAAVRACRHEVFARLPFHSVEPLGGQLHDKSARGKREVVNCTLKLCHARALDARTHRCEADSDSFAHAAGPAPHTDHRERRMVLSGPWNYLLDPLARDACLPLFGGKLMKLIARWPLNEPTHHRSRDAAVAAARGITQIDHNETIGRHPGHGCIERGNRLLISQRVVDPDCNGPTFPADTNGWIVGLDVVQAR